MRDLGEHGLARAVQRWSVLVLLALLLGAAWPGTSARAESGASGAVHLAQCIAPVRAGDTPSALFANPSRFDCRRPVTDWRSGSFWVRLVAPPGAALEAQPRDGAPRNLRFVPQWQRMIAIYSRRADGAIAARHLDNHDISRMLVIGGAIRVPLDHYDGGTTGLLVRIDGALNAGGLMGDPQIQTGAEFHGEQILAVAVFAAFAGLGIGLFCYNMVLWLTIRERFQLTYCLSLLAMLAYIWASSGAMAVQVPGISQTLRIQTYYLMLAFVGALALQFITDFVGANRLPDRLRQIARNVGLVCIAAAFAVVLAPPEWRWLADRVYLVTFTPLPPLVAVLTVIAWRRGSRSVRVLAIAWAVPLAIAVLRILHALHFVDLGEVKQYAMVVAMSIEALLSSLAMSFRVKRLTDERDRALADERAARHLANIDSLTGLLNRRALLEQVIEWASPEPLRLLLVDIDRFKAINDVHGHLVGDEVLREVAEVMAMRAELRGSVARLGGEEFAVIGTAEELPEGVALGILADMRARPMAGDVRLTVSIGMAEGRVRCEDEWRELYRRADAALYQAKSEGRNRAVHAALPCTAAPSDAPCGGTAQSTSGPPGGAAPRGASATA